MKTAYCPKTHEELASVSVGKEYGHVPGHQYHDVDVVISRMGDRYRVHVVESWGSAQGHDEEHGRVEVVARGDSLQEAIREARQRASEAGIVEEGAAYLTRALSAAEDEIELSAE